MTPNTKKRIFLIDGSSQMYRAYHAIRDLTGPDGRPTNAVYGFVTMLRKLIADHKPDFLAAAFDLAGPTFRSELADDYKANRPPMPSDLVEQVPLVHEVCEALGVPVLTSEKYEADDVIGTLALQAVAQGLEVVIVTSDKDFFQLVNSSIQVFDPRKTGTWFDTEAVTEKMGVKPSQVVDVLSLMGDAVDNVKGVPGIGKKGLRTSSARMDHSTICCLMPQRYLKNVTEPHSSKVAKQRATASCSYRFAPPCQLRSKLTPSGIKVQIRISASNFSRDLDSVHWLPSMHQP